MDPGEQYLAASFVLGICHHIDHVLRYDHSGWPFPPEVTPFTYSFLVYPLFLVAALSRRYPLLRISATALVFGFTTFSHIYFETPFDQYRTWAEGSPLPLHGIQHTLLNTQSPTAGLLAATITVLVSLFLGLALWQFAIEWRCGEPAKGEIPGLLATTPIYQKSPELRGQIPFPTWPPSGRPPGS